MSVNFALYIYNNKYVCALTV